VLTRSAGAVANALDKLVSLGVAQMVTDKPRTYRLAPANPEAAPAPARPAIPPSARVPAPFPTGVTPSRRAGRRPLAARYIRALTGVVSRQVHGRDTRGTRRAAGGGCGFPQQPRFLPHQHLFGGRERKKAPKTRFL
jgi:hypothetical protein